MTEELRNRARRIAAELTSPAGCEDRRPDKRQTVEQTKGLFKRTKTVEQWVEVREAQFVGWQLWRQSQSLRRYVQPLSTEESVRELWLREDGEIIHVDVEESWTPIQVHGWRKTMTRVATEDDLRLPGHSWQQVDDGATPAIAEDLRWVASQSQPEDELKALEALLSQLQR